MFTWFVGFVIMVSLAYNKQKLSIINANSHIVCDDGDYYQYHASSYPGHTVYRDLTSTEVEVELPKALDRYRTCYRATRQSGMEASIEHLTSTFSHRPLTELLKSLRCELSGQKMCNLCRKVYPPNVSRKCDSCSGSVSTVSDDLIFEQFLSEVKRKGQDLDLRYYPGTGYKARETPDSGQRVIPGDPDLLPPTTRENIAVLMNTAGNR